MKDAVAKELLKPQRVQSMREHWGGAGFRNAHGQPAEPSWVETASPTKGRPRAVVRAGPPGAAAAYWERRAPAAGLRPRAARLFQSQPGLERMLNATPDFKDQKLPLLHRLHSDRWLTAIDLRVAVFFLLPANGTGLARLKWTRLAKLTGASVPDVQRSVERLQGFGYFTATFLQNGVPIGRAANVAPVHMVQTGEEIRTYMMS
jgi:hypothetical protein